MFINTPCSLSSVSLSPPSTHSTLKAPERTQTHKLGSPSHAPSNSGDKYQKFPAPGNTHHHWLMPVAVVRSPVGEIPRGNHQHHPSPITQKTFSPFIFPCAESKSFTMIRSYRRWKSVSSSRTLSQNIHWQCILVHLTVAPMIARADPNNI